MAKIGTVAADFVARTAKFTVGVRKVQSRMQRLGKTVRRVSARMAGLTKAVAKFAAAGAAAAAGALALMVRNGLRTGDALAKASDSMGIATDKLRAIQEAAKLAGVDIEGTNKSILRMQRSIVDANDGLSTQARAFEKLGLDVANLRSLSPDEQFKAIADALSQVENASDKVNISQAIFGRQGAALIPLLNQGSQAINGIEAELAKIGGTLSRVDAAKIEQANDAITRLKTFVMAASEQMAVAFAPVIKLIADSLFGAAAEAGGLGNVGDKVVLLLVRGFGYVREALNIVQIGIKSLQAAFQTWLGIVAGAFSKLIGFAANAAEAVGMDGLAGSMRDFKEEAAFLSSGAFAEAEKNILDVQNRLGEVGSIVGNTIEKYKEAKAEIQQQAEAIAEAARQSEALNAAIAAGNDSYDDQSEKLSKLQSLAESVTEALKTPAQKLTEFAGQLSEAVREGFLAQSDAIAAVANKAKELGIGAIERVRPLAGGLVRSGSAQSQLATANASLGRRFDSPEQKAFEETKKQTGILEDLLRQLREVEAPATVNIA